MNKAFENNAFFLFLPVFLYYYHYYLAFKKQMSQLDLYVCLGVKQTSSDADIKKVKLGIFHEYLQQSKKKGSF
jgi:hypothetical protein